MKDKTFNEAPGYSVRGESRRKFLKTAGLVSGAAGLSAATLVVGADEAQAYDPGADETRARYKLSEDVKAFYRTNGYETLQKK